MTSPLHRCWKPGFSSLGCIELTLDQMFEMARKYGIHNIELRGIENQFNLPHYFSQKFPSLSQARTLIEESQIQIDCLGSSFKWIGAPEGGREEFIQFCDLAHQLKIPYVRVFGGSDWGTTLTEEDYQIAVREYQWWESQRERYQWNVQAVTETHDAFSASPPLLHLMKLLGKKIPIIWDTHHTWRYAGERPLATWNQLRDSIIHIHFKDSLPTPSPHHSFTYVLPGQGDFPIQELQQILDSGAYTKTVSLEWERKWHSYLPELQYAIEEAQKAHWI